MTLSIRSDYRELPAPRTLADRFICLWTQRIDELGGDYSHPVLPDGCADIIWIGDTAPVVAGPATQRIVVTLPAGACIIGARLRPGRLVSATGNCNGASALPSAMVRRRSSGFSACSR